MEANPWFASMPRAQREALLGAAELVHLRRGAMLFRQGDPVRAAGSGFYGLAAGTIKISTLRAGRRAKPSWPCSSPATGSARSA